MSSPLHPDAGLPTRPTAALAAPLPFEGTQPQAGSDGRWEWLTDHLDGNPRLRRLPRFSSAYLTPDRDISIWLPVAYGTEPARRFPVFYLHDGQNLFDPHTSYVPGHTWRAHSTADRLVREQRMEPAILVGINNTGHHRMAEYTPTRDWRHGGGQGPLYGRLLVDELKPLLDRELRTLPGPTHTGLGGSSLGGLISLSLGLDYPQVFGQLGILSPSVWWDGRALLNRIGPEDSPRPRILPPFRRFQTATPVVPPTFSAERPRPRIWLDMGMSEGLRHLRDTDLLHQRLITRGWREGVDLRYLRVPGGLHNEEAWARRFDRVLSWLFPPAPRGPSAA